MLAIIYTRVSTEDQIKGYSLSSQLEACRKRANELGATRIQEYIDEGISGGILERPGLSSARECVRAGGVSFFICYDPDRLARNLSHQLLITEEVEKVGTKLEFVNFDWQNTPEGKLFYSLRGAVAEYEKEKIRERTQRGKLAKARQGKLTHNPQVFGYDYDKEKDTLAVNTHNAEFVREIFRWFIIEEETGLHTIARRLTDMQIPTPKGKEIWQKITVKRILSNETYTGTLYLQTVDSSEVKNNKYRSKKERVSRKEKPREEWLPVKVPVIIDELTFQKAQRKLEVIKRRRPGSAKYNYLLSGLCLCGYCGSTMHGNLITKRNGGKVKKWAYYTCSAKSPGVKGIPKCISHHVPTTDLEALIWKKVLVWISNPATFSEEISRQYGVGDLGGLQKQLQFLEGSMDEMKKQREKIIGLYQRDLLMQEEVEEKLFTFKRKQEQLEKKKREIHNELEGARRYEISPDEIQKLLASFNSRVEELDFEDKRNLVRLLVDQVIIGEEEVVIKVKVPWNEGD